MSGGFAILGERLEYGTFAHILEDCQKRARLLRELSRSSLNDGKYGRCQTRLCLSNFAKLQPIEKIRQPRKLVFNMQSGREVVLMSAVVGPGERPSAPAGSGTRGLL